MFHAPLERQQAALVLAAALFVLPACRTADPLLNDYQGLPIAASAPATYRIGVLPPRMPAGETASDSKYHFAFADGADLQRQLVTALQAVDAGSEVVAFESGSAAKDQGCDVLLQAVVAGQGLEGPDTRGGRAALSSLLWLTTWFGGLMVDDKQVTTDLELRCNFADRAGSPLGEGDFRSGDVNMSFFERNKPWSGRFFLSLLLPPFLIGSKGEVANESVTEHALQQVARGLKLHVKDSIEVSDAYAFEALSPVNGAQVGEHIDLRCEVRYQSELRRFRVFQGATELPAERIATRTPPRSPGSGVDRNYTLEVDALEMQPGVNFVSLEIYDAFDQLLATHTLRFTR